MNCICTEAAKSSMKVLRGASIILSHSLLLNITHSIHIVIGYETNHSLST